MGYVDLSAGDIVVNVTIAGISIGTFSGNLTEGISFDVNLLVAKGHVKLYVDGTCLYVDIDISITFDGSYKKDKIQVVCW